MNEVDAERGWADAAGGTAALTAMLFLGWSLRPFLEPWGWGARFAYGSIRAAEALMLRVPLWAAILLAVLFGWRLIAAGLAVVATIAEIALAAVHLRGPWLDGPLLTALWPAALSGVSAVLLILGAWGRPARAVLGRRPLLIAGAAGVLAAVSSLTLPLLVGGHIDRSQTFGGVLISSDQSAVAGWVAYGGVAVLCGLFGWSAPVAVRGRVWSLLLTIGAFVLLANLGFDYAFAGAVTREALLTQPAQLALLAALVPATLLTTRALLLPRR